MSPDLTMHQVPNLSPDPRSEHTFDAGDLESALTGLAPAGRPPVFDTADVAYVAWDTPVGRMLLARAESGPLLASVFLVDDDAEEHAVERLARVVSPRVLRLPARLDQARHHLDEYFDGTRRDLDLDVDLALATPYQRRVLGALRQMVGYGERSTYGALASALDQPAASRAVGRALGANPLCVVLPCHRVVAGSGALTGYAGGLAAKEHLLALEAAH